MVRTCAFVEGCRKQPSFGAQNDTAPSYCSLHKETHHVDLKHDSCAYLGCNRLINPYRNKTATQSEEPALLLDEADQAISALQSEKVQKEKSDGGRAKSREDDEARFLCKRHADMMLRIRPPLRPTLVRKRRRQQTMGEGDVAGTIGSHTENKF